MYLCVPHCLLNFFCLLPEIYFISVGKEGRSALNFVLIQITGKNILFTRFWKKLSFRIVLLSVIIASRFFDAEYEIDPTYIDSISPAVILPSVACSPERCESQNAK